MALFRRISLYAAGTAAACGIVALAQTVFVPAKYVDGAVPQIPFQAVGGGEVLLELDINAAGTVSGLRTLRATPPFTDVMIQTVGAWTFAPALEDRARTDSHVLVAGEFRPPSINTPTLGELPKDVASPSDEVPFPLATVMPGYPPLARDTGGVLVEVRVDPRGNVVESTVIRSSPPFDGSAMAAARQWKFIAGRRQGTPVDTRAYIFFAFRQPVTGAPPKTP